jgi:hypothetical protein
VGKIRSHRLASMLVRGRWKEGSVKRVHSGKSLRIMYLACRFRRIATHRRGVTCLTLACLPPVVF